MKWREFKFALIQSTVLPIGILAFKLIALTWRIDRSELESIENVIVHKKVVLATYHGIGPSLLPFGPKLRRRGRQVCIMTSPSRDGLIIDRFVRAFRLISVKGSSRSRAVAGSLGLIREIAAGAVGILMVDGPRGPRCVPKAGVLRLAASSGARMFTVLFSADRFLTFGSWDRAFLPLPFTRIHLRISEFEFDLREEGEEEVLARLYNTMLAEGRLVHSHIVEGLELQEGEAES